MSTAPQLDRRQLLQSVAGLALAQVAGFATAAAEPAAAKKTTTPGKPCGLRPHSTPAP